MGLCLYIIANFLYVKVTLVSDKKSASIEDDDEDYEDYENSGKSEMGEDGEMVGGIYAKEKPVSSSSLFQVIPCLE